MEFYYAELQSTTSYVIVEESVVYEEGARDDGLLPSNIPILQVNRTYVH